MKARQRVASHFFSLASPILLATNPCGKLVGQAFDFRLRLSVA